MIRTLRSSATITSSRNRSTLDSASSAVAADHVDLRADRRRAAAISTLTRTCAGAGTRGRRRDHAEIVDPRPHPLAADVHLRRAVVHRLHDAFEAERPDRDAIADRCRPAPPRRASPRAEPPEALAAARPTASSDARASGARRPDVAGGHQPRRPTLGVGSNRRGPCLQRVDDGVDLPARLAHPLVEPLIEALLERLLALAQLLLAALHPRRRFLQHLPLARDQPALVIERLHVAFDLGQVLGELRSPARSDARAPAR